MLGRGLTYAKAVVAAGCIAAALTVAVAARPITTKEGVLPQGTELNEESLDQPTELFSSELAGGKRSYLLNLGDLLFSSPLILGGVARQAGMSCETCHQQGHNNPRLFVPGLSSRPGTFDTTNALFNAKGDNGVFDAVSVPSLRGAKYLAPYGHDGRFGTLREFIRNVIVNEFAGAEPSPQVLDALVSYVQEISFLPNPKLASGGKLNATASDAAHRGEALFSKPFPHDALMSCASCHVPSDAFVDHRVHDVGTGGWYKTPTLVNGDFTAPYFHDGRYNNFADVVAYFDKHFDLGLSADEKSDLVAYLHAVGDAKDPLTRATVDSELTELDAFISVLDTAIPEHNRDIISLVVDEVGGEWRELGEDFPPRSDTSVTGGLAERLNARAAVRSLVLTLRQIDMAAEEGDYEQAAQVLADYRRQVAAVSGTFKLAEPWSLLNPTVRAAHFAALNRLAELAK